VDSPAGRQRDVVVKDGIPQKAKYNHFWDCCKQERNRGPFPSKTADYVPDYELVSQ